MRIKSTFIFIIIAVVLVIYIFSSLNKITVLDANVNASWANVVNQYQRRADLIPNLVNTVKGYATHEASVFTAVTEARSNVSRIQISLDQAPDAATLQQFQAAQQQLTQSLSRLIAVSEAYPDLKANEGFLKLQDQLEGTENRITVARDRYIESVKTFNIYVKSYPGVWIAGLKGIEPKPQFSVENEKEISTAPAVQF